MGRRFAYGFLGFGAGVIFALALAAILGKHLGAQSMMPMVSMGLGCASITLSIAERKGKVKSREELDRPLTLFPREPIQKR